MALRTPSAYWELVAPGGTIIDASSGTRMSTDQLRVRARVVANDMAAAVGLRREATIALINEPPIDFLTRLLASWYLGIDVVCLPTPCEQSLAELCAHLGEPERRDEEWGALWSRPILDDSSMGGRMAFFTSGTTGSPQCVVHDPHSLLTNFCSTLAVQSEALGLPVLSPRGQSVETISTYVARTAESARLSLAFMTTFPLNTIASFTILQRALLVGDALVVNTPLRADALLRSATTFGVTNLGIHPLLARRLASELRRTSHRLESLVTIGIGSALCPPHLLETVEKLAGAPVICGYGATELGGPVASSRVTDPMTIRHTSVGRALPGALLSISATGELLVDSESLGTPLDGSQFAVSSGRWFHSGDSAELSADGILRLAGRLDDVILRAGKRIDPVDIEQAAERHPAILRACAVGMPGRIAGEPDIHLVIELTDNSHGPGLDDLRQHWKRIGAPTPLPQRVHHFATGIPFAPDGTRKRAVVRELLANATAPSSGHDSDES